VAFKASDAGCGMPTFGGRDENRGRNGPGCGPRRGGGPPIGGSSYNGGYNPPNMTRATSIPPFSIPGRFQGDTAGGVPLYHPQPPGGLRRGYGATGSFLVAIRVGSSEVILLPQQCRPRCRSHPIPTLSNDTPTGMYVTLAGSMWPMATPACHALPTYARRCTKLDSIGRMHSNTSIWDTHAPPETDTKLSFLLPCDGEGRRLGM
jgi:hypothetical protein